MNKHLQAIPMGRLKKSLVLGIALLCFHSIMYASTQDLTLKIVETSDVHGCFFPYDFMNDQPKAGSLSRLSTYAGQLRKQYGKGVIMLDNGDILQGQPVNYFSNFVDTLHENIAAQVVNYLGYDAETMGNHDVEVGHAVFDKWIKAVHAPMLGANIINTNTGKCYTQPYVVLNRMGVRIAVLGMITPAIPNWLAPQVYQGMRFDEMVSTAKKWMKIIKEHEKPDVIIGLFHSGAQGGITTPTYEEDAALKVAREVPGFDIVFFGHDHTRHCLSVTNADGKNVTCLDPANNAMTVAVATAKLVKNNGKWHVKSCTGELHDITKYNPDEQYNKHFENFTQQVRKFANRKIGVLQNSLYTRDCFFGNSAFGDFILNLQLKITGADIAFNAPLSFNDSIVKGDIFVKDMFKLYKYENQLYVMRLTGKEIHKYLEMSYDLWVNTMENKDDHLLLLDSKTDGDAQRCRFKNMFFNFDSAAGIDYEVDVTKPVGSKVKIIKMSNGEPFDEKNWYKVALNSYRANGGGELLTKGAGIPKDSLERRIIWKSKYDQRHYLMNAIERLGTVCPTPNHNWTMLPKDWVEQAAASDRKMLFGD